VSSLRLSVLADAPPKSRLEGPRRLAGYVHVRRPRPPFTATCYWVARRIDALDRALGVLAHDLGDVAHNGRKHTRLLGSTRESSTVLVLRSTNQTLGAPTPRLPPGRRPAALL